MKPIFTNTTLHHLHLWIGIWILAKKTTCAIVAFEVVVIRILKICDVFVWENLAGLTKLRIPTIALEVSFS
jgi:hypothetical protein